MVGATVGVTVFLVLLLLAVQVLYNLYATSVLTAATYDAARVVSGASGRGDPATAEAEAEARFARLLGRYAGRHVESLDFSESTDEVVVARVRARNPNFVILPGAAGRATFQTVDRRVRVRVERFQPGP